jgi:Ca2+-binding EF-hand superfamily protein
MLDHFSDKFDVMIVFLDVTMAILTVTVGGDMPNITIIRIFRLVRLSRALRILTTFTELYIIMHSFIGALKTIMWATLVIGVIVAIWAIAFVEILHPLNRDLANSGIYEGCERCAIAYSSVFNAIITMFQQIVAGDSWGAVSIPIMEEAPWFAPLFVCIVMSVSLGVMNLILAVIVESAAEAREQDLAQKQKVKIKETTTKKMELLEICAAMDTDASDTISLEEMLAAWDESQRFQQVLGALEVCKEDLHLIFKILDDDNSGEVDYKEFVEKLYYLRTSDMRLTMETQKLHMADQFTAILQKTEEHASMFSHHRLLLESIETKLEQWLGVT